MQSNSSKQHEAPENAKPPSNRGNGYHMPSLDAASEGLANHDIVHLRWASEDHALLCKSLKQLRIPELNKGTLNHPRGEERKYSGMYPYIHWYGMIWRISYIRGHASNSCNSTVVGHQAGHGITCLGQILCGLGLPCTSWAGLCTTKAQRLNPHQVDVAPVTKAIGFEALKCGTQKGKYIHILYTVYIRQIYHIIIYVCGCWSKKYCIPKRTSSAKRNFLDLSCAFLRHLSSTQLLQLIFTKTFAFFLLPTLANPHLTRQQSREHPLQGPLDGFPYIRIRSQQVTSRSADCAPSASSCPFEVYPMLTTCLYPLDLWINFLRCPKIKTTAVSNHAMILHSDSDHRETTSERMSPAKQSADSISSAWASCNHTEVYIQRQVSDRSNLQNSHNLTSCDGQLKFCLYRDSNMTPLKSSLTRWSRCQIWGTGRHVLLLAMINFQVVPKLGDSLEGGLVPNLLHKAPNHIHGLSDRQTLTRLSLNPTKPLDST